MNTNLIHNILNVVNVVLAASVAGLIATGCVQNAAGVIDCSASWIPASYVGYALMAINAIKLVMNVVRDGFGGLFKSQPPAA